MNTGDEDQSICAEKMTFDSIEEATAAATVLRARYGINLKPYICSHCSLWHLTSA